MFSQSVCPGGGYRWSHVLSRGWLLIPPIHEPRILQDMVDNQAVCILLECFLVFRAVTSFIIILKSGITKGMLCCITEIGHISQKVYCTGLNFPTNDKWPYKAGSILLQIKRPFSQRPTAGLPTGPAREVPKWTCLDSNGAPFHMRNPSSEQTKWQTDMTVNITFLETRYTGSNNTFWKPELGTALTECTFWKPKLGIALTEGSSEL